MHRIIFDCDNTMGVPGRDVDDGLAFLYLIGRTDVELLGITTTYGNGTTDIVYDNTIRILNDLNIKNIPVYKGAASKYNRQSEAAEFLADMAKKFKGEMTLLATGSLSNLLGAYEIDNNFFSNLKEIVLMGGITNPLIINGYQLDELNFSCDPEAAFSVLSSGCKVTVITGHICLQAFFGKNEMERLFDNNSHPIYKYISENISGWFKFLMDMFELEGFYNWDIVAALYITHPELFDINFMNIASQTEDLKKGYLKTAEQRNIGYKVNVPTYIKDIDIFKEAIFKAWENIRI